MATTYNPEKTILTLDNYYIDQLSGGKFSVTYHEKVLGTYNTLEEALSRVTDKIGTSFINYEKFKELEEAVL